MVLVNMSSGKTSTGVSGMLYSRYMTIIYLLSPGIVGNPRYPTSLNVPNLIV